MTQLIRIETQLSTATRSDPSVKTIPNISSFVSRKFLFLR